MYQAPHELLVFTFLDERSMERCLERACFNRSREGRTMRYLRTTSVMSPGEDGELLFGDRMAEMFVRRTSEDSITGIATYIFRVEGAGVPANDDMLARIVAQQRLNDVLEELADLSQQRTPPQFLVSPMQLMSVFSE